MGKKIKESSDTKTNREINKMKKRMIILAESGSSQKDLRNQSMIERYSIAETNTSQLLSSATTVSKAGLEKYLSRESL